MLQAARAGRASPEPQERLGQKATIAIARKWVRVGGNWFAPEGTQLEDTFI